MNNENGKRPTLKTIAELAGVSQGTVARALKDSPEQPKATNDRIKKIAEEVGYVPNAFARALASKSKPSGVGMIVPSMASETAYNMSYEYINAEAEQRGLTLLLGSCNRNIELEKKLCRLMCENRVGALLISPISSDISHITQICRGKVPVIFVGGKTGIEEEYYITIDYGHGLRVAVEHLHGLGHRDIALAVYAPDNKTIQQKISGYDAAMHSYNLSPAVYRQGNNADTFNAGQLLVRKLLDENKMPTAICCASDLMAIGVIDGLKTNGLRVPDDVSVIGHDDLFLSGIASFSVTTLAIPEATLAKNALDLVEAIINGTLEDGENKGHIMTASLVVRNTTARAKR